MKFKAGLVQLRSSTDSARNLKDTTSLIRDCVAQGAVFVSTPEVTNVYLRNRAAAAGNLDHAGTFDGIIAYVNFLEGHALLIKQRLGAATVAAKCGGIDRNISHLKPQYGA